ncbi:MAG TPA: peptidylprolyl isomerase [Polyangia bacterium]|nr:peptidylprolyl isomerase [Polyangia bacterium]
MKRAALLLLLLGAPAQARVVEKIAAVVGDDIVLSSEVEEHAAPFMQEIAAIPNTAQRATRAAALRREVLDRLVDERLIIQQAAELKLTVSSEDIDRSIEQIKRENGGLTDAQLSAELTRAGQSMASYRQEIKKQILRYRVLNIAVGSKVTVSDADVQGYYDGHMKSGDHVQVRASHIFVAIPDNADAVTLKAKEKFAHDLLDRAKGGEDFAKLAKEFSQDPATRDEGGDLGYFGRDMLPKPIEEMVFSMKIGEVRGPVRADRGFHVIKLVDRRTQEVKPLAAVKEELRNQLRQKEMERQTKNYLTELRKKTLVDVRQQ